ncbi:MAG: AAA family ATPase [Saprospiraceae bacterium]|nr:AAA family ATPase [Saprospiraceae bacterium]
MILEFTVGNFLSFRDPVTLSMETSTISDFPENTFSAARYTLLKSAVIYGANASGKSNLINAISTMRNAVKNSGKMSSADVFPVTPYLLDTVTAEKPCFFEILFVLDGLRYRYGFEVSAEKVHAEWLYQAKASAEKPLFIRDGEAIEVSGKFPEGKNLERKTRANALFLSVCDQFNGEIAQKIVEWFTRCNTISGLDHQFFRSLSFRLLSGANKQTALDFLDKLDLGFHEVQLDEEDFSPELLPEDIPLSARLRLSADLAGKKMLRFNTLHDVYDPAGKKVLKRVFNLDTQESSGTNKVFDLLGPIFDTLMTGKVLWVDELDAKMHPLLTRGLVSLFNSVETNPHNAQLIFATHDTNLLTYGNFRRDQIYFVEKDERGASHLYSLIEYKDEGKTVRSDRSFEKDYMQGRYGAIPYLGDFSKLFDTWQEHKKSPIT